MPFGIQSLLGHFWSRVSFRFSALNWLSWFGFNMWSSGCWCNLSSSNSSGKRSSGSWSGDHSVLLNWLCACYRFYHWFGCCDWFCLRNGGSNWLCWFLDWCFNGLNCLLWRCWLSWLRSWRFIMLNSILNQSMNVKFLIGCARGSRCQWSSNYWSNWGQHGRSWHLLSLH